MVVGFFPGDSKKKWGRDIHPWAAMATGALEKAGCTIRFLDADDIRRFTVPAGVDVIHLNWPQALLDPNGPKLRKYLPHSLYAKWFIRHADQLMRKLEKSNIPTVWQVHDLPHDAKPEYQELARYVFSKFYSAADGLLFYESSAQGPLYDLFGPPGDKVVGVAHLGGYHELHGGPVPKEEARKRLGIALDKKVFLYPGTIRSSRSPAGFTQCFIEASSANDLLYVTGRGTWRIEEMFSHERVVVENGMTGHDRFRDLVCASDFVVNDAFPYLGSAVIRVALGYGVPVIAYSFGCTADTAKDAFVEIERHPDGVREALEQAMSMSPERYQLMSQAATERDRERPWSAYADGCVSVYEKLLDNRTRD